MLETAALGRVLARYQPQAAVTRIAGLLTDPHLQANTIRIELLVHLAMAYCNGHKRPTVKDLGVWLNGSPGVNFVASMEDPVEDVFISNVRTPEGNRQVFEGNWSSNDYYVQVVLDTLLISGAPPLCRGLLQSALALLRLSDVVAERLTLNRWHSVRSEPAGHVPVGIGTRIKDRARAVSFTIDDLAEIGVSRDDLSPFILRDIDKQRLTKEATGHSSLERRPLVDFGDVLVLTLPHAVSPAIRRHVLEEICDAGLAKGFTNALAAQQERQVERDGLFELRDDALPYPPPPPSRGPMPSLHGWLLKYDSNKYLHVVLLHDRPDLIAAEGLSGFMQYSEPEKKGLQKYLNDVGNLCMSLPDCDEGMTFLILGGLGRGFMLGFEEWPTDWRLSVLCVPDLLLLAGEIGNPIRRFMKCIKQKEWAEQHGVSFRDLNGDLNLYAYWRQNHHEIVHADLQIGQHSMMSLSSDFLLPMRQELRRLSDSHVLPTVSGHHAWVMRLGRDAYFESMKTRPVYASLDDLAERTLAGVVETERGSTWLVMEPGGDDRVARSMLYEIWSGFIGLLDQAVAEIEGRSSSLSTAPVEIRLDFRAVKLLDGDDLDDASPAEMPEVGVDADAHVVRIRFPQRFLKHFHRPENVGEQILFGAIVEGLLRLHANLGGDVSAVTPAAINALLLGNVGARVLHLFHVHVAVEHLLATGNEKARFLAKEDIAFERMNLAEGCVPDGTGKLLSGKDECNAFLHAVVDKIWDSMKNMLRRFERTDVIRHALEMHESLLQDRDHWNRTAQAVLALYTTDDVYSIAEDRERDRNHTALPARTLMEMALCECPIGSGRPVSRWDFDTLLAKAALLFSVASDSDAVMGDIVEPKLQLHENGTYAIDLRFHETVIRPFISGYFHDGFDSAARDYDNLYKRERYSERKRADEIYSADFVRAFTVEFGLSPDDAIDGLAELFDLAVEKNSVVVETTVGELRRRFAQHRGMSEIVREAFISKFGLFSRPEWEKPPRGYRRADIWPWRFRRPLSSVARPLLIFGNRDEDTVMYGVGQLRDGIRYLFERINDGQLPQVFFRSAEMKAYIGAVADRRGHNFEETVATKWRTTGWNARSAIRMTELGGSQELGDIDVLAWNGNGMAMIVECKRLMLSKTIAEISDVCSRFRGEARDELAKHLARVQWVKENRHSLEKVIGFTPEEKNIDAYLVTNTDVPMMYLSSLPIAKEKVLPLRLLSERLSHLRK
jgi:hypothetical protein